MNKPLGEPSTTQHRDHGSEPDGAASYFIGSFSGTSRRAPSFGLRLLLRKISQQQQKVLFSDRNQSSSLTALQFVERQPSVEMMIDEHGAACVPFGVAHAHQSLFEVTPRNLHAGIVAQGDTPSTAFRRGPARVPQASADFRSCRVACARGHPELPPSARGLADVSAPGGTAAAVLALGRHARWARGPRFSWSAR